MTEDQFVSNLVEDLDQYAAAIKSARATLKTCAMLSADAANVAHELRRVAGALMTGATSLQQAQRIAAAEARTSLVVG